MELELYSRTLSAPVSVDETAIGEPIRADHMATIQVVSSTTNPGLDCRFGEMRDLREIPPAAEGINDRF